MRSLIRSKIHKATVTGSDVAYVGSIAIDRDLVDRARLWLGEKVLVVSNTTGARLETYVIEAPAGSGTVEIRGAAAHVIQPGEEIIIMGFEITDEPVEPTVVLVDGDNRFVQML
jgi:aspartate 1-decarboxylase